jgi:hypothetical protein
MRGPAVALSGKKDSFAKERASSHYLLDYDIDFDTTDNGGGTRCPS